MYSRTWAVEWPETPAMMGKEGPLGGWLAGFWSSR